MKKHAFYEIAILLVASLLVFGTANAGWFGSDDKQDSETQAPAASDEQGTLPQSEEITISGTIDKYSQLVDDQGKAFQLADSEEGRELKNMIGKKVEITGTVMEEAGQKVVEVHEYKVLEE